ncbi:hypothetical protein [Vibrio sp. WXL103]|uniref:hypothetical protein n=1 Tax=unclassified Vibrio TaxID=2614977 RepID=UPI003EC57CD8
MSKLFKTVLVLCAATSFAITANASSYDIGGYEYDTSGLGDMTEGEPTIACFVDGEYIGMTFVTDCLRQREIAEEEEES